MLTDACPCAGSMRQRCAGSCRCCTWKSGLQIGLQAGPLGKRVRLTRSTFLTRVSWRTKGALRKRFCPSALDSMSDVHTVIMLPARAARYDLGCAAGVLSMSDMHPSGLEPASCRSASMPGCATGQRASSTCGSWTLTTCVSPTASYCRMGWRGSRSGTCAFWARCGLTCAGTRHQHRTVVLGSLFIIFGLC